jgi:hypothetical protein
MRPTLLLAALCATFAGHATALAKEIDAANILFVIADDWGNGHAGAYGCTWVKTPNFDRLAKEGLLFLNAYTPTAKCPVALQHHDRTSPVAPWCRGQPYAQLPAGDRHPARGPD